MYYIFLPLFIQIRILICYSSNKYKANEYQSFLSTNIRRTLDESGHTFLKFDLLIDLYTACVQSLSIEILLLCTTVSCQIQLDRMYLFHFSNFFLVFAPVSLSEKFLVKIESPHVKKQQMYAKFGPVRKSAAETFTAYKKKLFKA